MTRSRNIVAAAAFVGFVAGLAPALAQTTTFRNYHCADGTDFIVASYPYDSRIYLQIDGGPVTLQKRLAFWGARYSGGGVTLKVSKGGATTVRRSRRRETACEIKPGNVQ